MCGAGDVTTLFKAGEPDITDIEAETLYSLAFSFYSREMPALPVETDKSEEKIIEDYRLLNPRTPCGPSFIG